MMNPNRPVFQKEDTGGSTLERTNQSFQDILTPPVPPADSKYPIRDIFYYYGPEYLKRYGWMMTEEQKSAVFLIGECKKGERLGTNASFCPKCKKWTVHNNSCNSRSCPNCQAPLELKWVDERSAEVIEGIAYYHTVITLPSSLNDIIWANGNILFPLMMRTANQVYVMLFGEKKYGGYLPQIISVLHTQGSTLQRHPHVHSIISGGGLNACGQFIEGPHKHFCIPESTISACFKGAFLKELKELYNKGALQFPGNLSHLNNRDIWDNFISNVYNAGKWVAFVKETFNGNGNAIKYLGRYMFRTAISNSRIAEVDYKHETVTIKYKDWRDTKEQGKDAKPEWKHKTMNVFDFMKHFLDHVLPKGVHRATYGGLLASRNKTANLKRICKLQNRPYLVSIFKGRRKMSDIMKFLYHTDIDKCKKCGGKLVHFNTRDPDSLKLFRDMGMRGYTPLTPEFLNASYTLGFRGKEVFDREIEREMANLG